MTALHIERETLVDFLAHRLPDDARARVAAHIEACPSCGALLARFRAFTNTRTAPPERPFERRRMLARVRETLREQPSRAYGWVRGTLATVAVTAVVVFGVVGLPTNDRDDARPVASVPASAPSRTPSALTVLSRTGSVLVGERSVEVSDALAEGARISLGAHARLVLAWDDARVVVEGGETAGAVVFEHSVRENRGLHVRGVGVALDVTPMHDGRLLAVRTEDVTVRVTGTRFLVDARTETTGVAVDRGSVVVATRGRSVTLRAGERLMAGAPAPLAAESEEARFLAAVPSPAVDGVAVVAPPVALGAVVVAATSTLEGRESKVESRRSRVEGRESRVDSGATPVGAGDEPEQVLGRARALARAGSYDEAMVALHTLQQAGVERRLADRAALVEAQIHRSRHEPARAVPIFTRIARGTGPEAEQALFVLGQTQASDLRDSSAAIATWRDYERRFGQGMFGSEVVYRLGVTLLDAGRTEDGVSALRTFVDRFPRSRHAPRARELIGRLGGQE